MNKQKSLMVKLIETIGQYLTERRVRGQKLTYTERRWLRWLGRQMMPNIGTLLMVVVLLLTIPSLAAPLIAPSVTSTSTISYQGHLADSTGVSLTGKYNLEFRIYDVPAGGVPLWTELWVGANAVDVSEGLFSVMLGSIDNTLASSIEGYDELYLGITVGGDSEMIPRVQLGSVPFSMQAMTVPDGSITTGKLVDGAVTSRKLGLLLSSGTQTNAWYSEVETEIISNTTTVAVPSNVLIIWSSRRLSVPSGETSTLRLKRNGITIATSESSTGGYNVMTFAWFDEDLPPGSYTYQLTAQASAMGSHDVRDANLIVIPLASP